MQLTPSSFPVMIAGGQLVDPHLSAARQHAHAPRDARADPLILTLKRICAGTAAPAERKLADIKVLVLGRVTTLPVASCGPLHWPVAGPRHIRRI